MSCKHNYESYNGDYRCTLCDDRLKEWEYVSHIEARITELQAENKRLHFELQQHHEQNKYVVKKLEAENAKLRAALVLIAKYTGGFANEVAIKALVKPCS